MIGVSSKGIAVARSRLRRALDLVFAGARGLDPRITFSRTTNATLTNSAGLVANAPMNLLTYSEQFDNAAWAKLNSTVVANTSIAPDGTTTADRFISAGGTYPQVFQDKSIAAGTYTASIYVKSDGTSQIEQVLILDGTSVSFTPTSEWTRVSVTKSGIAAGTKSVVIATNSGAAPVSSFYIWGAQLELGSTATAYNPTTVKNLLGYTEHFDNAAWTKSNAFVQTNLLTYSQDFDNAAWPKFGATVTANTAVAPDGTTTADTLVSTGTDPYIEQGLNSTAVTHTVSVWLQGVGSSIGKMPKFYLVRGAYAEAVFSTTLPVLTAQWQRYTFTGTFTVAPTTMRVRFDFVDNTPVSGDTVNIWGAQLVQGTSAGDYKATYAAAAAVGYTDIYGQPFAQKLVEDTATGSHAVTSTSLTYTAGTPYSLSFYAKAGERQFALIQFPTTPFGSTTRAYFNILTGTVGAVSNCTAAITSEGNGWYRCSITATAVTGGSGVAVIYASPANGTNSYTGDGTSGIYIFGAQLSDSASVDPYVYNPVAAPSAAAYYGPRFDYDASTATYTELLGAELFGTFSRTNTNESGSTYPAQCTATTNTICGIYIQPVPVNTLYAATISWSNNTSNKSIVVGGGTWGVAVGSATSGTATVYINPTTSVNWYVYLAVSAIGQTFTINSLSVKQVLGLTGTGATPKGLLIEEQRTNLVLQSQAFTSAAWAVAGLTRTDNASVSPSGETNAASLVSSATSGVHVAYNVAAITVTAGATTTLTAYVKANGYNFVSVFLNDNTANYVTGETRQVYNLASGTVGTAYGLTTGQTASIAPVGNGWFRISLTQTFASAARNISIGPMPSDADPRLTGFTGNGTSGMFIYGAQLEAGAFATSYIPTVASQVTRAADSASMIGNNFARWYNQTAGTLYFDSTFNGSNASLQRLGISVSDGTTSNRITSVISSGTVIRNIISVGGAAQADMNSTVASTFNTSNKNAVAYAVNDFATTANGLTPQTDTSGSVPVVNQAWFGQSEAGGSTLMLNGTIKRIAYYNRRLSNTELQGITS